MDSLWQSPVRRLGMITPITNPRCVQFLKVSQGCAIKPQPQGNHSGVVFYAPVYCDSIKSCYLLTWLHRHQCINFLLIEIVSFFYYDYHNILSFHLLLLLPAANVHSSTSILFARYRNVFLLGFIFYFFAVINVHYH